MAFKMKPKKDLEKGAKESDSRKSGPGGTLPDVADAKKNRPGVIGSLLHKIASRMAAEKKIGVPGSGQEFPQAVPPKDSGEKAAKKDQPQPEKKGGAGDVSIAGLTEDIAKAGEALKKKDVKTAEALYWSITETYNQLVSDPKCNVKAAKAIYGKLTAVYTALSKLRSIKGEDIVFKPLNEAGAADKNETNEILPPRAGKEVSKKGGSAKFLPEEQIIYTVIDSMIEIVESKGEISLQELSKIFNMQVDQIEELAKILDEHEILQLHYPSNPLAHPLLRSVSKHDFKRLGRQD